ncbi:MAG: tRNA (adenosine(37)-N6)-threonylcarbamoyltransferase complex dimerization subunit type 1 TsaB [Phascolarctobacterium sp.]|uniref:tRNA (adenosine(37)-N6)-threonylcarbamoyltransferase complex dimerization subunit type 1 TsaB n=1 Tax=Phascolarctobacterium sp. TaxID=2049039 RepID=UPI0026DABBE8|nr:tRNA (adenosine(37)-N6)-threonylcarbamoyltransferase complex dimerization subunit type 1 TsaB [Phascolarctobacterium sp.]MDO4921905.1 tRNA (adenosine(37)-N6)-threonylcarbamoyltransferase complex dimerization subunit type 1 TsaB [Phascolarctobacterium sp.]
MLTLAIDTATKVCTAALCRERELLAEYTINMGMTHSEGLLPQLEQLLARTGTAKKDIGLLAVSMGPGSFTGLRIGLATAEAMAYSWRCCLHGVDTLKALAYNTPLEGLVLSPVLDAQKGNFYQALYRWQDGRLQKLEAVQVVSGDRALERIALQGSPALLLGECARLAQKGLPCGVQAAPQALRTPRASSVAWAALDEFDPEADRKIFGLEPYYIRRSEAEELWEKKQQQQ